MSFIVSRHALDRIKAMGIDGEDVREAMLNPRYQGDTSNGRELRTRGKVTLVVSKTDIPVIVTVLWATAAAWVDDTSRPSTDRAHMDSLRRARKSQKRKTRGKRGY